MDPFTAGAAGSAIATGVGTILSAPFQIQAAREQRKYLNSARDKVLQGYGQGIDTAEATRKKLAGIYDPYVEGAKESYGYTGNVLSGMERPDLPIATNYNASTANPYLKQMSKYQMDTANQALQASALARGGVGGGLAKAIANNSAKYATQNVMDANKLAMAAADMNFNQGNTLYKNEADWLQKNFENNLDYTKLGTGMTNFYTTQDADIGKQLTGLAVDRGSALGNIDAAKGGSNAKLFDYISQLGAQGGGALSQLLFNNLYNPTNTEEWNSIVSNKNRSK